TASDCFIFFQAEDGMRGGHVTGVQTCALPIYHPASELLEDIILPSKSIEHGFETYVVELASGDIANGIMSAQTAATITLRQEQGRATVIARQDIKSMRVSKVSMMPEGLEKQISVSQMADLLTFLKAVR